MMVVENRFELSDIVYLKTDKEQDARMVTGFLIEANGLMYKLTMGSQSSWHSEMEITETKDVLKATTN